MKVNWKNAFKSQPERSPAEDQFISGWADWVSQRRLTAPAIVFAEMAKPFSWLLMNLSAGISPILGPFVGFERMEKLPKFFANRENLEHLIRMLEERQK